MKKLFFISGVLTFAFGVLFLFGILDLHHTTARAFTTGNRLYAEEAFNEALEAYNTGLQKEPGHPMLNYNAAQACYRLEAYDKAAEFYGKAPASVDLYLNWGNSFLRLGNRTEDINQKLQYYANALETYKQGILAFPQNVELKYNYEYVQEKLKALQDDMENQQQNNQENQEDQAQNQQDGGQSGSPDPQNDRQGEQQNEADPQDNQQGEQNEENSQDNQQSDGQSNPEEENGQQNPGDQQAGNQDEEQNSGDQQQESSSRDEQQQSGPSAATGEEKNQDSTFADEPVQSSGEIERILEMLEKQEEQALKNNQKIRDSGKEDKHDW